MLRNTNLLQDTMGKEQLLEFFVLHIQRGKDVASQNVFATESVLGC